MDQNKPTVDIMADVEHAFIKMRYKDSPEGPEVEAMADWSATHITEYCKSVIESAYRKLGNNAKICDKNDKPLTLAKFFFTFNGLKVPFDPFVDSAEVLEKRYMEMSTARHEAYLKSPEYAERQRKNAQEVKVYQDLLDAKTAPEVIETMVENLSRRASMPHHDFLAKALLWFCDIANLCDRTGVVFHNKELLIKGLEGVGVVANMNTGDEYVPGNRDNTFDYLLGQIAAGFKEYHAPHPVLNTHSGRWIKTWANQEIDTFDHTMEQIKAK